MAMIWRIVIAGLIGIPASALGQGYDDPRLAEYGSMRASLEQMREQARQANAQACAMHIERYCKPMQFPPHPSVEEMRARMQKQ